MFDSFRRSLGLTIARRRLRRLHDTVVTFTGSVSTGKQALVIMPAPAAAPAPSPSLLTLLKQWYGDEGITIVLWKTSDEVNRLLPRSTVIRMRDDDVTSFFLPRPDVLERIRHRQYDLAIDLNLDFDLPSGYICRESRARIRVGFAGKGADTFFNFLVQPNTALGQHAIYDRLVKCLQMF